MAGTGYDQQQQQQQKQQQREDQIQQIKYSYFHYTQNRTRLILNDTRSSPIPSSPVPYHQPMITSSPSPSPWYPSSPIVGVDVDELPGQDITLPNNMIRPASSLSLDTDFTDNNQQPYENYGHFFVKKTFHKPTYCHHCVEMLWGLIGQGYYCEGNFDQRFDRF